MSDGEVVLRVIPNRPSHSICLSLQIADPEEWALVWGRLNRLVSENFQAVQSFSLSSYDLSVWTENDEEVEGEGEYHDENTLFTVFQALRRHLSEAQAQLAIQDMQNASILFRQRR